MKKFVTKIAVVFLFLAFSAPAYSLEKNVYVAAKLKADFPIEKAVKIGNGKNIIIEVTDPDCPFCRKASDFFAKRNDVTRYIFFLSLTKLHPNAEKKSRFILSSKDQTQAHKDVMSGKYDQDN